MFIASFWEIAAQHVFSFLGGLLIGFILSNRYRLVKRNGENSNGD